MKTKHCNIIIFFVKLIYLLDNIHAFNNLSKHNVLAIKPGGLGSTNEKLRTIGVGSGIGHTQNSGTGVSELEIFIFEFVSIDGFSTGSIMIGKISSLTHKIGDHTMKSRASITETFFAGAKSTEIFSSLGNHISS